MNKLRITLAGVLALGIPLPAVAGPDFQTMHQIEQAQKARQAEAAMEKACESGRLVLLLDHGPHATSTPYLNQLRKERFEAEMKACKEAAATKR